MGSPDMLEAFLDQVPDEEKEGARQLVHGMRLFALSAQKDLSPAADLPLLAARNALCCMQDRELQNCLDLIMNSLLGMPAAGRESVGFGTWPESAWFPMGSSGAQVEASTANRAVEEAWIQLRATVPSDTCLPLPGATWDSAATDILALAPHWRMSRAWIRLWVIRLGWVRNGPSVAEKALTRWWGRFGAEPTIRLSREVAWHRAALASAHGQLDLVRALIEGESEGRAAYSSAAADPLLTQENADALFAPKAMECGPDIFAECDLESDEISRYQRAGGVGAIVSPVWSWDGEWGTSGCWVACCSPQGRKTWMRTPDKTEPDCSQAEPDELERRAIRSLRLEISEVSVKSGSEADSMGARISNTRIRASVCVCEQLLGQRGEGVSLGRILGWVTWEWSHTLIPAKHDLIQAAKRLVLQHGAWLSTERNGTSRSARPDEEAGRALRFWFAGLARDGGEREPMGLWHYEGKDWVKVLPDGAAHTTPEDPLDPKFEDLERCVQLGLNTLYGEPGEVALGELIPLQGGSNSRVVIAWKGTGAGETESQCRQEWGPRENQMLWSFARNLKNRTSDLGLEAGFPLTDNSFARFIRRLGEARRRPQHLALVASRHGMCGALVEWLEQWSQCADRDLWACKWIPGDSDDSRSLREALNHWEARGEPFQVFHVPDLVFRKNEVTGWVLRLSQQQAPLVTWEDAALACMWRQPWCGQEPQLASVVARVVQIESGSVTRDAVEQVLVERGHPLVSRLDSKRPLPEEIASALFVTRRTSGRWNKTRASAYLGWDPDTLVARMRDLDWQAGHVPEPDPWGRGALQIP
ncbi:MAG: hypothetical protein ACI89E_000378 [Planctomycetota bacterium]|jgi:hypothetical protein